MAKGRKKKRTHAISTAQPGQKVPKSFVFSRGKVGPILRKLESDIRKLMLPNTAMRLRESSRNSLKDFLQVAGPLGVSHFMVLSNTKESPYLRLSKTPRGPTLTFKICSYSLMKDIAISQSRPRAPPGLFSSAPLVVMNNFGQQEEHLKLATVMFQNLFPPINVNTVKLASCQRVLVLNYNKDTKLIDFRHYSISAQPVGVTRNIRKLVQKHRVPDLGKLQDVSEFLKSGYGSESEVEDEASKVTLAQDLKGRGNRASNQSAVKLQEVGPRMELQLIKVEAGLSAGDVLFHEFVHKTPEEAAALRQRAEQRESLKKQRRAEQEANVAAKKAEMEAKKRKRRRVEGPANNKDTGDAEEDDDEDWYRKEVGEEPDEAFVGAVLESKRRRNERRAAREEQIAEEARGTGGDHDDEKDGDGDGDGEARGGKRPERPGLRTKARSSENSLRAKDGKSSHRLGVRRKMGESAFKKSRLMKSRYAKK